MVTPSATDTYTYNGLGLRVGKTDSTGSYSYVCDGTTPGSPVLIDGHTLYTPGLSENRGGTSVYYDFDRLGNLWTADGTGKSQYAAVDYSAFGITLSGSAGTPFGYGGANGCQTDLDASLVMMGHRYFDPRTGRFISQDPAGSGDNWYAYADNNPVNETDPSGLSFELDDDHKGDVPTGPDDSRDYRNGVEGTYDQFINGKYAGTDTIGLSAWDQMNNCQSGASPGAGMARFANNRNPTTEMRLPKPVIEVLAGVVLGGLAGLLPGSHGQGVKAPERQATPPTVSSNADNKKKVKKAMLGVGGVALGIGLWEGVKWTIAVLAAPETLGGSVAAAAVIP